MTNDGTELSVQIDLDRDGRPIGIGILDVTSRGLEGDLVIVDAVAEPPRSKEAAAV